MATYNSENVTPGWAQDWEAQYLNRNAHAFTFFFNVHDVTVTGLTMREYITRTLAESIDDSGKPLMDVIVFYNRATGFSFPELRTNGKTMKEQFIEIVGLAEDQGSSNDNMLASLGLGGGGGGSQAGDLPTNPGAALPLIDTALHSDSRIAVVIDYPEMICPNADPSLMSPEDRNSLVIMHQWGRDKLIEAKGSLIALITESLTSINPALVAASSRYAAIRVDLPRKSERAAYIEWMSTEPEFVGIEWEITPDALANGTAGLGLVHIRDIFYWAQQTGTLAWDLVKDRKDRIVASEYADVLEMIDPQYGWERIGGLAHVKEYFNRSVIAPMRAGNYKRVPMGVLMTGPAGTGKSAVAKAVAKEAGVNAVELKLSKILGQYVGNSERNLEKAIQAIRSLAPTIVFMDEIDQTVSRGGGGDSGVSSRIFSRLLEFMSETEHRGQVVFLAATNRPDLMDAALRRPGRFDRKIPFLVPDMDERGEILRVMARVYGLGEVEITVETLEATDNWTGAELEAAAVKAGELVEDENLSPTQAINVAVRRLRPSTSDIEFMTMLALKETNDLDLLPERFRSKLNDRGALEAEIEQRQGGQVAGRSGFGLGGRR